MSNILTFLNTLTVFKYRCLELRNAALILYIPIIIALCCFTVIEYNGNSLIYLTFTVVFNSLLLNGFHKKRIFFDTFIGLYLWLGFWLKFSVRMAFMDGKFYEPIGTNFNYTGAEYDQALIVATIGASALLLDSYLRTRCSFIYTKIYDRTYLDGLFAFYTRNRAILLWSIICFVIIVAMVNAYFGIYQRGTVPKIKLPLKFDGIFKWLLLFGTLSASALFTEL